MAFIFLVLIFISFVIKALSLVPKFLAKKERTEAQSDTQIAIEQPVVQNEELSQAELTAVITAAIMAYTADNSSASADGLVVRSVKRKGNGTW